MIEVEPSSSINPTIAIELLERSLLPPTYPLHEALNWPSQSRRSRKANEMARRLPWPRDLVYTREFLEEDPDRLQKRRLTEKWIASSEIYESSDLASI
jgi:hypothetical protein